MALESGGGKRPGKVASFTGRRRAVTRKSGFTAHQDSSGGEFREELVKGYSLNHGDCVAIAFLFPPHAPTAFVGYGGWFALDGPVEIEIIGGSSQRTLAMHPSPNWSKFGSMWVAEGANTPTATVRFTAQATARLAVWGLDCGTVAHKHIDGARPVLLRNMFQVSPEGNFYDVHGQVRIAEEGLCEAPALSLILKSCNRCARYLPINVANERCHLSFSNHCLAPHRRPCRHAGFSTLTNPESGEKLKLEYGFQLECRFCKKFEVNAAHNPKRTAAQMKEDAARRRGFELLAEGLYKGTPQLRYRLKTGSELAEDVFEAFRGRCFNCETAFGRINEMHLDHTRPLALLWPLDGTATALCGDCNSAKRDRPPPEFYSSEKLRELALITGILLPNLQDPTPNMEMIDLLMGNLEWFFDEFLKSPEMLKERDGKVTGELVVKALQKVLASCSKKNLARYGDRIELMKRYNRG
jgi:hypothetical protein